MPMKISALVSLFLFFTFDRLAYAHGLAEVVSKVKPSVVGIGVYDPLGSPRQQLHGTGFVVGDGTLVATNYHVVETELATGSKQSRVVFIGEGASPRLSEAEVIASDPLHDLALLRMKVKLTPLKLSQAGQLADGTEVGFTGFPIGAVLGLYPATHRGLIAAYTPVIIPSSNASQLSIKLLKRLKEPYFIYQMDATAYPGNSGSPVYELEGGEVVAIINKVFVQQTKESAITNPSGITYSVPVGYLAELLASVEGPK
jgi:serine protease Do